MRQCAKNPLCRWAPVEIDGYELRFTSDAITESFESAGFQVEHSRSRLSGMVSLLGMFNTIDAYEFDCPLVKKPELQDVWGASYRTFTPCYPEAVRNDPKFRSPCELPEADSGKVILQDLVEFNGVKYQRRKGKVAFKEGASVAVQYSSENAEEQQVQYARGNDLLQYEVRDDLAIECVPQIQQGAAELMGVHPESIQFA
jgi:hypothetical protein